MSKLKQMGDWMDKVAGHAEPVVRLFKGITAALQSFFDAVKKAGNE